ncbi:MAG: hypothetical protein OEQ49_01935 [Myxococcales bacterium]|nr:hypothetical protein [Myxococcales bacterium]
MNHPATYVTKTFFFTACLVLGCSSGGTLGCGSSEEAGPEVDSELTGIYQINTYQSDLEGCDQAADADPPGQRLVLYGFSPDDDPQAVFLGGVFCNELEDCRDVAKRAPEPIVGYAFRSGDDASGWVGFAVSGTGLANDQCQADVQEHALTATSGGTIAVETQTFETVFPPIEMDGTNITCRNGDALAALTDDLPCTATFLVEATLEASL